MQNIHNMQILLLVCLLQGAFATDTESTTPKGETQVFVNVETLLSAACGSHWKILHPQITPRPKPYSERTAIKFTSKVEFNLLPSPFRYLDISLYWI